MKAASSSVSSTSPATRPSSSDPGVWAGRDGMRGSAQVGAGSCTAWAPLPFGAGLQRRPPGGHRQLHRDRRLAGASRTAAPSTRCAPTRSSSLPLGAARVPSEPGTSRPPGRSCWPRWRRRRRAACKGPRPRSRPTSTPTTPAILADQLRRAADSGAALPSAAARSRTASTWAGTARAAVCTTITNPQRPHDLLAQHLQRLPRRRRPGMLFKHVEPRNAGFPSALSTLPDRRLRHRHVRPDTQLQRHRPPPGRPLPAAGEELLEVDAEPVITFVH